MPVKSILISLLSFVMVAGIAQAANKTPLNTAPVSYIEIPRERFFEGLVEATNQATVAAQTSGRILEIGFDVDDFVQQGQVIVRIHDKTQRSNLQSAEAAYREAESRSAEAEAEFARISDIHSRKLISKSQLDAASANRKAAKARLQGARARVDTAKEQLAHTLVRAPYSGIVRERLVEVGEFAQSGRSLMTGLSLDHLRVKAQISQSLIQLVRKNVSARIVLAGGKSIAGQQMRVFPVVDPNSHTVSVRMDLPFAVPGLYPGMMVKVAVKTGTDRVLVISESAVVHRSEVTGAYVVKANGEIRFRQIRSGRRVEGGVVRILAGLSEGELVALDPIEAAIRLKSAKTGADS